MSKIVIAERLVKAIKLENSEFSVQGETVLQVLENLCEKIESLKDHLFHNNGDFKNHFMLILNDEHASLEDNVSDDDTIEIILATSGGVDAELSKEEFERYSRHILLSNVGKKGQEKLKNSKVIIVGTGGLGSPVSIYLAAAGVGKIGLIDFDYVEDSNLQRQIVHSQKTVGMSKVDSAKERLLEINRFIEVATYPEALTTDNADRIMSEYDLIIDGSDNFSTRYLVNNISHSLKKPLISGAIAQFEGQVSVFNFNENSPCYRCIFPSPPPPELSPNCSSGGVIGVLPGIIGTIQATEAIKVILGIGNVLSDSLLRVDALGMNFDKVKIRKNKNCQTCSTLETDCSDIPSWSCEENTNSQEPDISVYIKPVDLHEIVSNSAINILNVRESMELEICSLQNTINIPLKDLDDRIDELNKNEKYYIVCLSGGRAKTAYKILDKNGFEDLHILQGGMRSWINEVDKTLALY